ncbi:P-loop containing nucleoside triphosphate hydrolase protein [Thamnidium elegans]|nr:P-loop containing nucleoside triphosphate hydrolase protein [Thamnidium elegans]
MAPLEVIGAGWGRTGTDSLRLALNILGYNTHHMKCFFMDPTLDTDEFLHAYHHREEADWDKLYQNYSAGVDWPTSTFYKELIAKYPDAKVILTERSADSWYQSVKNTIHIAATKPSPDDPKMQKFKRMVHDVCVDGTIMNPITFADEEAIKASFVKHNEEVKQFVPADKLLILGLGEGWERLCEFLGKEVPDVSYPCTNSTEEFRRQEMPKNMKDA